MTLDLSHVPVVKDPLGDALWSLPCIIPSAGIFAEFGVAAAWRGSTTGTLAQLARERTTLGFDSFEGLPERWGRAGDYPAGMFAQTFLPDVPGAILVVGLFSDTCPRIVAPCALAHIDCDLYSSTVTALAWVKRNAVPGCIVVFDEFYGYEGCEDHEQKALAESGLTYEPLFRSSVELEKFAIRLVSP
ncbi:MAG: TylF/MycF/NovP-related O-methyltransferase [Solirubrobacterales bacterium]